MIIINILPPCAHEILGLDLGSAHLALLGALFNLCLQRLLLLLEFDSHLVELSYRLIEHALILAQTLGGRHALAEGPFEDLDRSMVSQSC